MGNRQRELSREHVDAREGTPRTADHVEGSAPRPFPEQRFPECRLERAACFAFPRRVRFQSQHAQRRRDAAARPAVGDLDQFEAATTQITDDSIGFGDARQNALAGEPRFLFGTQHLARKADAFDLANELGPVLGVANGGGRDDVGAPDFHMGEQNLESFKRAERLGPRLAGKPARPLEAGAEAREHFLVEDRRRDSCRPGIDDQPHGVRPDVDNRDGLGGDQPQRPRLKRSLGTLRPFFSA